MFCVGWLFKFIVDWGEERYWKLGLVYLWWREKVG